VSEEQSEYITSVLESGHNHPKGNKMSKLLIHQPPLQFQPSLAVALGGVEEAIVIQQIHYWLENKHNTGRVDENGQKWVFNTYEQWKEDNFPFWSVDKIQRTFLNLEKLGVVISAQLDAKKRDMTKFYRIDYDALCVMDDSFLRPSNTAKTHDVNKNTETTTETTTEKPKSKLPAGSGIDWLIASGATSEEIAASNEQANAEKTLLDAYEEAMGYGTTLDWWGKDKDLQDLRKFLVTQTREDIETFAKWCNRQFSRFGPENAKRYPRDVMTFWPLAFKAEKDLPKTEAQNLPQDGSGFYGA